jgi:hypothetical protein
MRDSQLLLIPGQQLSAGRTKNTPGSTPTGSPRHRLDERTRSLGLEGIAAARAVLRAATPPAGTDSPEAAAA